MACTEEVLHPSPKLGCFGGVFTPLGCTQRCIYYPFLRTVATLGSFLFSCFLTLRRQRRHHHLMTTASGHQQQQRQGRCRHASGRTAQQERTTEGTMRAVGARRGSQQHWQRQVDNVIRASDDQRTAGGCSDDGGSNVVARTAGSGRCNKTRWVQRRMWQDQTETTDNATRVGGDKDSKQHNWVANVVTKAGGG